MRIITLSVLVLLGLIFLGCTMGREYAQFEQFNISFEMSKAHKTQNTDTGIKIWISGAPIEIRILEDKSNLSSTSFYQMVDLTSKMGQANVANVVIDGKPGKMVEAATGGYGILYKPVDGYVAIISSYLPMVDTYNFLGRLKIQTDQNAILKPQMSAKPGPNEAIAWNNKGLSFYHQGKYNEAIQAYDMAIEIDPTFADAWQNKGHALNKLGKDTEANACFWKATGLNAGFASDRKRWVRHGQSQKMTLEAPSIEEALDLARSKIITE